MNGIYLNDGDVGNGSGHGSFFYGNSGTHHGPYTEDMLQRIKFPDQGVIA